MTNREKLLQFANNAAVSKAFDDIGADVGCCRHSKRESDKNFSWRLALHIAGQLVIAEERLEMVLSLQRHPTCNSEQPQE